MRQVASLVVLAQTVSILKEAPDRQYDFRARLYRLRLCASAQWIESSAGSELTIVSQLVSTAVCNMPDARFRSVNVLRGAKRDERHPPRGHCPLAGRHR